MNTENVPEKFRNLAHAWVDGAEIEWKNNSGFWGYVENPLWIESIEYRIKPKPKVKKWRWVRESIYDGLCITSLFYTEALALRHGYIQKIDSTLIEVDAE